MQHQIVRRHGLIRETVGSSIEEFIVIPTHEHEIFGHIGRAGWDRARVCSQIRYTVRIIARDLGNRTMVVEFNLKLGDVVI